MSVKANYSQDKDTLEISIDGAFDFNLLNNFRDAYKDSANNSTEGSQINYVINLRSTSSIDSSALGMLLNMKRTLNKKDKEIQITHCQPQIKKILIISRFDRKFSII
jgi:HptB-dependent secretion and biofilm anti anti-sigma factor